MLLLAVLFLHNAHLMLSSQVNDRPDVVIPLSMHAKSVRADVSPTNDGIIVASLVLQAPSGVPFELIAFPKDMAAGGGVFPSDPYASTVVYPPVTLFSKEQALLEDWMSWHEAFGALKDEFKNGAKVPNSIKKLLPQGNLSSFVLTSRVKVRSGLPDILAMFFEKVEGHQW